MEKSPGRFLMAALAMVGLVLAGCSENQTDSTREQASINSASAAANGAESMDEIVSDRGASDPVLKPDSVTVASLDQSYSAYISCLRPKLDGVMRVDFQRYVGVAGELSLPDGRDDQPLIEQIDSECQDLSQLDARLSAFSSTYSLNTSQVGSITTEVVSCLRTARNSFADELESLDPGSIDDLTVATTRIPYPDDPVAGQALLDCVQTALYGDPTEF